MAIKPYLKDNQQFYEVYVNGMDNLGRRLQLRRRNITSKARAEKIEFELKREVADKLDEGPPRKFKEWHQLCLQRMRLELRPSTIEDYGQRLSAWIYPTWDEKDVSEITAADIHGVVYSTKRTVSLGSRRVVLKMIKRILQMAIEEGLIERNPGLKIKIRVPQTKQLALNATEVDHLLREAKINNHRFYYVWAVALLTGMRSGELYALKWTEVDFENRRLSVSRSWSSKAGYGPTKTARNRVVPISSDLEILLKEMKLKTPADYEYVLPHLKEWTSGYQAFVLRDYCKTLGITSIKFHDLRATFITQLLLKGVSVAQVMAVVGHTELKTTNAYLRVVGADLSGVTDRLSYSLPQDRLGEVIDFKKK